MNGLYDVDFTALARKDLRRIARTIFERSGHLDRARDVVTGIQDHARRLDFMPHRGAPAPWLGPRHRTLTHRGFAVILYRIEEDTRRVVILRVFARGQNWRTDL